MAVRAFGQANQNKEAAMQMLRDGKLVSEVVTAFNIPERTAYRYKKEIDDEKKGIVKPGKSPAMTAAIVPGVSKDSFTPQGAPSTAPPGSPTPEYLTIGTFRMPMEDWGYSNSRNLFIVVDTYEEAKRQYGYPKGTKVGDFTAYLCEAFRLMLGWDSPGAGLTGPPALARIEQGKEIAAR